MGGGQSICGDSVTEGDSENPNGPIPGNGDKQHRKKGGGGGMCFAGAAATVSRLRCADFS